MPHIADDVAAWCDSNKSRAMNKTLKASVTGDSAVVIVQHFPNAIREAAVIAENEECKAVGIAWTEFDGDWDNIHFDPNDDAIFDDLDFDYVVNDQPLTNRHNFLGINYVPTLVLAFLWVFTCKWRRILGCLFTYKFDSRSPPEIDEMIVQARDAVALAYRVCDYWVCCWQCVC